MKEKKSIVLAVGKPPLSCSMTSIELPLCFIFLICTIGLIIALAILLGFYNEWIKLLIGKLLQYSKWKKLCHKTVSLAWC